MKKLLVILLLILTSITRAQVPKSDWPLFRGRSDLSGLTAEELPSNPALLWSLPSEGRSLSSPVISGGVIYFANDKGTIFAVGKDKKILWEYETGTSVSAPPLAWSGKIFIGTDNGLFIALDKNNGKPAWSYKTDSQIAGSANYWVAGKQSGVIFGSYDYCLHCLEPSSGRLQWKLETQNYINGTPSLSDNKIVFGGCDGFLRVVDPVTGRERDTLDIGVYIAASPAVDSEKAYFGDYNGNFYCADLLKGKVIWKSSPEDAGGSILSVPATNGNVVIVGREDKYLYCYNSSGKMIWKFRTNGSIKGSAVISASSVLFGSSDGYIYMLQLTDGKKIWSFNAGSPVNSSPAVSDGSFYFLTDDGRLLAFGIKTEKAK
jgi:outer membrane protein assembly factor BamB